MKTSFGSLFSVVLLTVCSLPVPAQAAHVTNLLAEPGDWKTWAQRAEVAPRFELLKSTAPGAKPVLAIDSRNGARALRLRFADTDTQLRARDVIQSKVPQGFVVALNRSVDIITA